MNNASQTKTSTHTLTCDTLTNAETI